MSFSMTIPRRRALFQIGAGAGFAALACRRPRSPEDQVRDTIAALARAIEDKDTRTVRGLISERYKDAEDQDRAEVLASLQLLFKRHPRIHLLTRVTLVEFRTPNEAFATVVVAMASTPIKGVEDLAHLQADINRFDLTLAEDTPKHMRVMGAAWQTARLQDLF